MDTRPPPTGTPLVASPVLTPDEKTWGMLAHLSGIVLGFLGPLITMLVKGKESAWVDANSKEALNFEITALIAYAVIGTITCGLGIPVVWVVVTVLHVIAAMKVNEGQRYQYPATLRLLK
jgi:uncharacterized protein